MHTFSLMPQAAASRSHCLSLTHPQLTPIRASSSLHWWEKLRTFPQSLISGLPALLTSANQVTFTVFLGRLLFLNSI